MCPFLLGASAVRFYRFLQELSTEDRSVQQSRAFFIMGKVAE